MSGPLSMRRRLAYSALTLLLFLASSELVLGLAGYRGNPRDRFLLAVCGEILAQFDEELFWSLPKVTPSFGPETKCLKVACLTDSVSVMYKGKGYPELLGKLLSEEMPDCCPVVFNGGVPGYTTFQGLRFLERRILAFRPDVVSVCFGLNDHLQSGNGLPDRLQRPPAAGNGPGWLSHLRLFNLLEDLAARHRARSYEPVGPPAGFRVPLSEFTDNLKRFVRICASRNIRLILMTSPYVNGPPTWLPVHLEYNQAVRQVAAENRTPLVDLVDRFRDRPELFLSPVEDQVHYNWEGARLVAKGLADAIKVSGGCIPDK